MASAPKLNILSIDSGSSFMKAHDGSRREMFPSVVRAVSEEMVDMRQIKVKGQHYLVGYSAQTSKREIISTPALQPNFHGSDDQYVQICYAMQRFGIDGPMDTLVCSLPFKDSINAKKRRVVLDRKEFQWSSYNDQEEEVKHSVSFKKVSIVAQGVGAMNYDQTQEEQQKTNIAALVDIGSCTTDVVTIIRNKQTGEYEYCMDACDTVENANVTVFKQWWVDNIRNEIRNMPTDDFDYYRMMDQAIEENFVMQYGDRKLDTRNAYEKTRKKFSEMMLPKVREVVGSLWEEGINQIIFTGGGTSLINFSLINDKRVRKLDQWANVIGQYNMISDRPKIAHMEHEKTSPEARVA